MPRWPLFGHVQPTIVYVLDPTSPYVSEPLLSNCMTPRHKPEGWAGHGAIDLPIGKLKKDLSLLKVNGRFFAPGWWLNHSISPLKNAS